MDDFELDRRFDYHRPDAAKQAQHQQLRDAAKYYAEALDVLLPEGREKALALTNLEQSMFWGNAAIAREGFLPELKPEIPAVNDPGEAMALNDITDPELTDEHSAAPIETVPVDSSEPIYDGDQFAAPAPSAEEAEAPRS